MPKSGGAMRKRDQTKGIFCIEGLWDVDLRDTSTVRPLLELLQLNEQVAFIHREYATREELDFYLGKWVLKRYEAYPILYLTCHGVEGALDLGGTPYPLEELAALLAGKCEHRVIMFSSCSTLGIASRDLQHMLEVTGALAVCGYKVDVDWMRSTAFELLLFAKMQDNEFSGRGVNALRSGAEELAAAFKDLDFTFVTAAPAD